MRAPDAHRTRSVQSPHTHMKEQAATLTVDFLAWLLALVGFITVGLAIGLIVFLCFEDTFRRLLNRPRRLVVPVTDSRREDAADHGRASRRSA